MDSNKSILLVLLEERVRTLVLLHFFVSQAREQCGQPNTFRVPLTLVRQPSEPVNDGTSLTQHHQELVKIFQTTVGSPEYLADVIEVRTRLFDMLNQFRLHADSPEIFFKWCTAEWLETTRVKMETVVKYLVFYLHCTAPYTQGDVKREILTWYQSVEFSCVLRTLHQLLLDYISDQAVTRKKKSTTARQPHLTLLRTVKDCLDDCHEDCKRVLPTCDSAECRDPTRRCTCSVLHNPLQMFAC